VALVCSPDGELQLVRKKNTVERKNRYFIV